MASPYRDREFKFEEKKFALPKVGPFFKCAAATIVAGLTFDCVHMLELKMSIMLISSIYALDNMCIIAKRHGN